MHKIVTQLGNEFADAGERLFLVGGSVRDAILHRESHDFDFTTAAVPDRVRVILARHGHPVFDVGEKFGTLGTIIDGEQIEITTFRAEQFTHGSRKPQVEFGTDLTGDLSRRDFTINAIAMDAATGEVFDPFGGTADITWQIIRAVGNAHERFRDDPLRILRAFRFKSQLGFLISDTTQKAASEMASELNTISRERIAAELTKILMGPFNADTLEAMEAATVLHIILPEMIPLIDMPTRGHKDVWLHTKIVVNQAAFVSHVRIAALFHDIGKPQTRTFGPGGVSFDGHEAVGAEITNRILTRLKFSNEDREAIVTLVRMHMRAGSDVTMQSDSGIRRLIRDAGEQLENLIHLASADVTSKHANKRAQARARIETLRNRIAEIREKEDIAAIRSPLNGNDLMALFNRKPGAWLKPIIEHLTNLVVDGSLMADDRDGAERIAREMVG